MFGDGDGGVVAGVHQQTVEHLFQLKLFARLQVNHRPVGPGSPVTLTVTMSSSFSSFQSDHAVSTLWCWPGYSLCSAIFA